MMNKLNPFAKKKAELVAKLDKERHAKRAAALKAKRSKAGRKEKVGRNKEYEKLQGELEQSFADAEKILRDEEIAGNYVPGDTDEDEEDDE